MKKDIREILHYDIIENVGIGDIKFGMTMDEFSKYYDVQKGIKDGILRIPKQLLIITLIICLTIVFVWILIKIKNCTLVVYTATSKAN